MNTYYFYLHCPTCNGVQYGSRLPYSFKKRNKILDGNTHCVVMGTGGTGHQQKISMLTY